MPAKPKTVPSVFVPIFALLCFGLSACHNNTHQANNPPAQAEQAKPRHNLSLAATNSLGIGRSSAIFGYLTKKWQIVQLNNIPTKEQAILDLTQIEKGVATLSLGTHCQPLLIDFNISQLEQGIISTRQIEREIDDCSDDYEDRLMSIFSDLTHIYKSPVQDELVLVSYQDKILLTPAP